MGGCARGLGLVCVVTALSCSSGMTSESNETGGSGGTASPGAGGQTSGGAGSGGAAASNQGNAGASTTAGTGGDGGTGGAPGPDAGGSTIDNSGEDAPATRNEYTADASTFLNPERGFYTYASLTSGGSFASVRSDGKSIVYTNVELQDYLGDDHEQDLPQTLLDDVQEGFDAVRAAGLKAIVRFRYDDGAGYPDGTNDAPEMWMLRHIEQLTPLFAANEDVLFLLQAGFIGAWGEWHTSNNFADGAGDAEARGRIVAALLDALPNSRRTAVRYPAYKRMFFGNDATAAADLTAGAALSRVGHINDCFVSSSDDVGTYQYEPQNVLEAYLEDDTALVPIGGETCAVDARNACTTTLAEMTRFHYSYINDDYHPDVLQTWSDEGCRPEIERRLGYRLALLASELPETVRPGGSFTLKVELQNDGFAAPTNPRPVFLVLENGDTRRVVQLEQDPRLWVPGAVTITARIRVPSDATVGGWRVALWLPDQADSLRNRPEYAIRLAAQDVWNAAAGDNTLGNIDVSTDAPGDTVDGVAEWLLLAEP